MVLEYNRVMGGVDLVNQTCKNYYIQVRLKKWYWSLVTWFFNIQMVQAWRLYRYTWRLRNKLTREQEKGEADLFEESLEGRSKVVKEQARKEKENQRKKKRLEERKNKEIQLLEFIRQCVEQILVWHSLNRKKLQESRLSVATRKLVQFDHSKTHFPLTTQTKGVCQNCKQRSFIRCQTCDVALHVNCFIPYHTPS